MPVTANSPTRGSVWSPVNGYCSRPATFFLAGSKAAKAGSSLSGNAATVVLNPDHAAILARANMSRDAVAERLHALTAHSSTDLARVAGGFAKSKSDTQSPRHSFRSADDILILMAGGSGLYSMVMPSWCAGPHQNSAVSVQVEVDQFCEVPGSS